MKELERQGERTHCLNCKAEISDFDAYCSNCGQKVDDNKLALKAVINEFFENYISLDSRFGRSLFPFLFKPGFLARQFMEGKRRSFANPFRLYILSSIFFFFCLTSYIKQTKSSSEPIFKVSQTNLNDFKGLSVESRQSLDTLLRSAAIKDINDLQDSGFAIAYQKLKPASRIKVIQTLSKEELHSFGLLKDTLLLVKEEVKLKANEEESSASEDRMVSTLFRYKDSTHLSDQEVYQKVVGEKNLDFYKEVLFKRLIRLSRANESELRSFVIGNLSLAMFVLIPLFALVLKLFYRKRNRYYVAHLIHTLYLQAFSFMLFGLGFGLLTKISFFADLKSWVIFISLIIFLLYFFKSLRLVYEQSRRRTFLKGILLLASYALIGFFVFIGELVVSFLVF